MIKAYKAVYSYMFPEVRDLIFETFLPSNSMEPDLSLFPSKSKFIFEKTFLKNFFQSPEEMDNLHIPILNNWKNKHNISLIGINDFKYMYPTAGSEEGIREFMSVLSQIIPRIYVLKDEYEGYQNVAKTRLLNILEIKEDDIDKVNPGWFFISNPSARDGNIISNSLINKIGDSGHKIFYDLAYLDSTNFHQFDLSHKNIITVVMSFSKPYGLFYFRFGALFSRIPVESLEANKWFKVVPSLLIADKIINSINPDKMVAKYKPVQEEIVKNLQKDIPSMECSDALIISHIKKERINEIPNNILQEIEIYKRGNGYRFCLTPYFREILQ